VSFDGRSVYTNNTFSTLSYYEMEKYDGSRKLWPEKTRPGALEDRYKMEMTFLQARANRLIYLWSTLNWSIQEWIIAKTPGPHYRTTCPLVRSNDFPWHVADPSLARVIMVLKHRAFTG
jgi:hypothetical protein